MFHPFFIHTVLPHSALYNKAKIFTYLAFLEKVLLFSQSLWSKDGTYLRKLFIGQRCRRIFGDIVAEGFKHE